jgi:hypothetical protein
LAIDETSVAPAKGPSRKEVNSMKYVKPDLAPLASAIEAVQTSTGKNNHVILDGSMLATTNAYEADE